MSRSGLSDALLTDLYELTMGQAYWREQMFAPATFSLFIRGYQPDRAYYAAAGLDTVLTHLENFRYTDADLRALSDLEKFDPEFLEYLKTLRFTGDVRAVPEGTLVFGDEPLIEVTAPVIEAQVIETFLLNQVTVQTSLLTKATRVIQAAAGRPVADFAARRAHGTDAAGLAARCAWLGGFAGTSNVRAAATYGIPAVGTMAHSFVEVFESEVDAFRSYATTFPDSSTLLIDTYDTLAGAAHAVTVAKEMEAAGRRLRAVRIDSGDLFSLSAGAREVLDDAGLDYVGIVASGGLDEFKISDLVGRGAAIDSFGVGTRYGVSADAPWADSVYKLVEFDGSPRHKLSPGKETLPGPKQVYRLTSSGPFTGDIIATATERQPDGGEPLLVEAMADGRRTAAPEPLSLIRERLAAQLERLPGQFKALRQPDAYPVSVSENLRDLARQAARRKR